MKWKKIVADYFRFTRKDRIGLLLIAVALLAVLLLPVLIRQRTDGLPTAADSAWVAAIKRLERHDTEAAKARSRPTFESRNYEYAPRKYEQPTTGELFPFDPNTLAAEGWRRLGLRDKTIETIGHYLAKGGRFRKKEDLQRVYGIRPDQYQRLAPYMTIAVPTEEAEPMHARENPTAQNLILSIIDINTADTTAFILLPGIGSRLAARIIQFRERLGGFYSVEQVREIYGLADSVFRRIKSFLRTDGTGIRKLQLNTATLDELKNHPYIRYNLARAIIAYRDAHGPFGKPDDVRNIMTVTDEVYHKLAPYLDL